MANAQYQYSYQDFQSMNSWNNRWIGSQFPQENVTLYVPNGYDYQGVQSINGDYYAQFRYGNNYYQQLIPRQERNGVRIASIVLNTIGATILGVSNSLQYGNGYSNYGYQPYYQYNYIPQNYMYPNAYPYQLRRRK